MNGLTVFGLIFLLITLFVRNKLTSRAVEGQCDKVYKTIENNKKWVKRFLIISIVI